MTAVGRAALLVIDLGVLALVDARLEDHRLGPGDAGEEQQPDEYQQQFTHLVELLDVLALVHDTVP